MSYFSLWVEGRQDKGSKQDCGEIDKYEIFSDFVFQLPSLYCHTMQCSTKLCITQYCPLQYTLYRIDLSLMRTKEKHPLEGSGGDIIPLGWGIRVFCCNVPMVSVFCGLFWILSFQGKAVKCLGEKMCKRSQLISGGGRRVECWGIWNFYWDLKIAWLEIKLRFRVNYFVKFDNIQ